MANVVLRFQKTTQGSPKGLAALLEPGSLVSVSSQSPGAMYDVTVDNTVADAVAVATELIEGLGFSLVATDPAASLEVSAREALFAVAKQAEISDYSPGISFGSDALASAPASKASIDIPAEDETFIITAVGLIKHSNVVGRPSCRLRKTSGTPAVLNTVNPVWHSKNAAQVHPMQLTVEFPQTEGAGVQTVELEFGLEVVNGTMDISDVRLRAVRKP